MHEWTWRKIHKIPKLISLEIWWSEKGFFSALNWILWSHLNLSSRIQIVIIQICFKAGFAERNKKPCLLFWKYEQYTSAVFKIPD